MTPGELYLVDFGPPDRGVEQARPRPAIVVHNDQFSSIPNLAIVCPMTTARRGVPNHVLVPATEESGLRQPSYVMTEQIRAVDRRFVRGRLGVAPRETTAEVLRVLHNRILARS